MDENMNRKPTTVYMKYICGMIYICGVWMNMHQLKGEVLFYNAPWNSLNEVWLWQQSWRASEWQSVPHCSGELRQEISVISEYFSNITHYNYERKLFEGKMKSFNFIIIIITNFSEFNLPTKPGTPRSGVQSGTQGNLGNAQLPGIFHAGDPDRKMSWDPSSAGCLAVPVQT